MEIVKASQINVMAHIFAMLVFAKTTKPLRIYFGTDFIQWINKSKIGETTVLRWTKIRYHESRKKIDFDYNPARIEHHQDHFVIKIESDLKTKLDFIILKKELADFNWDLILNASVVLDLSNGNAIEVCHYNSFAHPDHEKNLIEISQWELLSRNNVVHVPADKYENFIKLLVENKERILTKYSKATLKG